MQRTLPLAHSLRPHGVALAVAALVCGSAALAQTAAPAAPAPAPKPAAKPDAAAQQLDTIVVSGTRASQQGSIARKRTASTVSDSIVAEDVDQFPDKNVGEALSRITGVQLTREFGEGSQVAIRGVEPDLNRIEINGKSVLGSNGTGGRGAELRELPAELISSIDVVKGSTADMTEGGIGGTVRINTRKPLDFKKPTASVNLSAEHSTSRGGVQPRATLLWSDKFFDNKLGLMANLVYDKVYTRNDYSRNTSWTFLRDWDFSDEKTLTSTNATAAAVTSRTGCATLTGTNRSDCDRQWFDYAPRISRYGIWERNHGRKSAELTAQYAFSKDFDVYASYQLNKQAQRLNDMNFGTDLVATTRLSSAGNAPVYNATTGVPSRAGTCNAISTTATPAGMVVKDHHVTEFVVGNCINVAGVGGQGAFGTAARDFALDIKSTYKDAGFKFKEGGLKVEGQLVDSKSDYVSQSNAINLTQNAPGLVVKLDGQGLPHFTFPAGYSPDEASSYVQAQMQFRPSATFNTERQGKLDFQYQLEGVPFFNRLWWGAQGRESTSKQYNGGGYLASTGASTTTTADDINVRGANINQTVVWDPLYTGTAQRANDAQSFINSGFKTQYVNAATMQSIVNGMRTRSPGTFFGGYGGVSDVPSSWMAPSYALAAAQSQYFDTSAFTHQYVYESIGSDGKTYPQIPAFDVKEKIKAAYVRADFDTEIGDVLIDGNVGVRYTSTNVTSGGIFTDRVRVESSPGSSTFTDAVRANTIRAVDNSYKDVLPSFNATAHLIDGKLLARVGWAKVMARPAINLLAPNANCIEGSGKVQFGGDGVDDCSAGNPDLKPYRATKNDFSLEYYPSRDTQLSLALFRTQIKSYVRTGIRTPGVDFFGDGRLYDVTQPVNAEGAQTRGVEIAGRTALTFLPGWMSGFGVDANYTRMSFSYATGNELLSPLDGSVLPYPGLSKNAYNLGFWYDQGMVNARIAYNKRDAYYTGGNDVSGNPNFRDATGYLDAKLQLRLTSQLTVAIEGKNLTDQAELTYSGALVRPNELAWSGRRYYVSVGYKF